MCSSVLLPFPGVILWMFVLVFHLMFVCLLLFLPLNNNSEWSSEHCITLTGNWTHSKCRCNTIILASTAAGVQQQGMAGTTTTPPATTGQAMLALMWTTNSGVGGLGNGIEGPWPSSIGQQHNPHHSSNHSSNVSGLGPITCDDHNNV